VRVGRILPKFRRKILPPSSESKKIRNRNSTKQAGQSARTFLLRPVPRTTSSQSLGNRLQSYARGFPLPVRQAGLASTTSLHRQMRPGPSYVCTSCCSVTGDWSSVLREYTIAWLGIVFGAADPHQGRSPVASAYILLFCRTHLHIYLSACFNI
jgi:hypothetical protein